MSGRRIAAVLLRIVYLYRGSPARVFPLFIWVAVDILLWGFLTRYLNAVSGGGVNFVPALLGAVLLWDFLTRVMQGVTMAFFEDVWSRNFLNFFATPLRISEYLAALILVSVGTSVVSLIVMIVFAGAAFGLSFLAYGAALAPFLMTLFVTGIAFGVAAAALVLKLGPASEWLVWPIPMIVSPFAGSSIRSPSCPDGCRRSRRFCRRPMSSRGCALWWPANPPPGGGSPSGAGSRSSIWRSPASPSRRSIAWRFARGSLHATAPSR